MHSQAETSEIEKIVAPEAEGEDAVADTGGFRVMVIDDSKTIRRTAETLLRKEGFDVVTAMDGFEGTAASATGSKPDRSAIRPVAVALPLLPARG